MQICTCILICMYKIAYTTYKYVYIYAHTPAGVEGTYSNLGKFLKAPAATLVSLLSLSLRYLFLCVTWSQSLSRPEGLVKASTKE